MELKISFPRYGVLKLQYIFGSIFGGIAGNLTDRLFRGGAVVDLVSWALTGAVVDPREPGEVGAWFGLDEPARGRRRRRPSPRAEVNAQVEPERGGLVAAHPRRARHAGLLAQALDVGAPEEERLETLQILRDNIAVANKELSKLPLTVETPSLMRRKNELERKIEEIEAAIKIFSRPKVFIQDG